MSMSYVYVIWQMYMSWYMSTRHVAHVSCDKIEFYSIINFEKSDLDLFKKVWIYY